MFGIVGDLSQMANQERELRRAGFAVRNEDFGFIKLGTEEEFKQALTLIWRRKIDGWWHYKDEYVKFGICTAEDWKAALKSQVETKQAKQEARELNSISESEIEQNGKNMTSIICEECGYDTGYMDFKSAVFKVNMQGGYFSYDGDGGPISKCPACEEDKLITYN